MAEGAAWRIHSDDRWWSAFGKKKRARTARPASQCMTTLLTASSPLQCQTRCSWPVSPNTALLGFQQSSQRLLKVVVTLAGFKYSNEQKERFFELVDRGGTVRAAARAATVSGDAAYRWLRQAGLSMQRARPRKFSEEEKAEFFRRLAENPNVSAAARELGITRVTCYSWACKAGIRTSEARKVNPRREEFLGLCRWADPGSGPSSRGC